MSCKSPHFPYYLRRLIDQHAAEAQLGQAGVARTHARAADDVGILRVDGQVDPKIPRELQV